jgi:hypothetical protein
MSDRANWHGVCGKSASVILLLWALFLCKGPSLGGNAAEPTTSPEEKRVAIGKGTSSAGALLQREASGKVWKLVDPMAPVFSTDTLLVLPAGQATLTTNSGVELTLVGSLPLASPLVLESAVVLHENPDFDLDLTVDRGRVLVTNHKEKGPARIRFRLPEQRNWDLTLLSPGDKASLELWGRWTQGVPFSRDAKTAAKPTREAVLCIVSGRATLKAGTSEFALNAPPGPALFHWVSDGPPEDTPQRLTQLPPWLDDKSDVAEKLKSVQPITDQLLQAMKSKGPNAALADLLQASGEEKNSEKASLQRQLALFGAGAMDDPDLIGAALASNNADVRSVAIAALRHWIGRNEKQDMQLFNYLISTKQYKENQAETVLQLLHSFSDSDLTRPETFAFLIDNLMNEKLAIRALSQWHLNRLVLGGADIKYDPAASAEERKKGYEEWKKLVPSGQVPKKKTGGGK